MVKLSIIIPSFNRVDNLKMLLMSIKKQRGVKASDFEIIVVYGVNNYLVKQKYEDFFSLYGDDITPIFVTKWRIGNCIIKSL